MPRCILSKNPLLRVYPGTTLADGYTLCSTNLYAPADWNRADDKKPRSGRYHIWTVENGRLDGIHVDVAAKNQAIFNAPSAMVQLFPTVDDAREYLAQACRRSHPECQERNTQANAPLKSCEQTLGIKRRASLPRDCLPHEVRNLRGDVWAYAVLKQFESFPWLESGLWVVVGNMFITQDRIRAMRQFIQLNGVSLNLAMHLHQAILTAVRYDDTKVVVLENGDIYHGDDKRSDNEERSDEGDFLANNWCVNSSPSFHCIRSWLHSRFADAAIAGQALGGDIWVVHPTVAARLQLAIREPQDHGHAKQSGDQQLTVSILQLALPVRTETNPVQPK
ncbi:hypothetical protein B0H19DRAFT_1273989 [Mycena capillaripes]|nr:hypothetical protein B0H19DRAFT_1273989 [Mycena capillaripes]